MRRRDVLSAGGGALALPVVGRAAATRAQSEYAPLGRVDLPRAKEAVVDDDGSTVYAAVTDGFAAVDVSDPANPTVIHENRSPLSDHEDGPLRKIYDVRLDGAADLLAVAGPANPAGAGALKGVAVYDVAEPSAPERVSFHETEFFNHNCHVADGTVYLCGNDGQRNAMVTVDAESGERLGSWSIVSRDERWRQVPFINWPLHDLWVRNGVAYLAQWDAGTWMVDVSDPAAPELIARVRGRDASVFVEMSEEEAYREGREPPGNDHFVMPAPSGDVLAIGVESWDTDPSDDTGAPGGVHLYDVTDPASAAELASIDAPPTDDPTMEGTWTTSHNFELTDDLLFTSWYAGGVKVHDVTDPAAPTELVHWQGRRTTSFWTARRATDEFFVGSSRRDPSITPTADQPEGAAIYTFPVPDRPTPTPTTGTGGSGGGDGGDGDGGGPTAVDGAGFGAAAALCALGVGAWRALRADRRG